MRKNIRKKQNKLKEVLNTSRDNAGLLNQIIKNYNNAKMEVIKRLASEEYNPFDEIIFIDNGIINSKIDNLKKNFKELIEEVQNIKNNNDINDENYNRLNNILIKQQDIKVEIAFLASNNFSNIDSSLNLIENINTDFKKCLLALNEYIKGNENESFKLFYDFFKDKNELLNHFLINKTYGTILYHYKQYKQAVMVLQKAVEKKPEDKEIHLILKQIYIETGQAFEEKIEENIISLLG